MFKKICIICMMILVTGLGFTSISQAQNTLSPEDMEAAFSQEGPVTAKDMALFIELAPELMKFAEAEDETKILELMEKRAGWNAVRGPYVTTKIANGYMMLIMPEEAALLFELAEMPASLIPGPEEMQMVEKNRTALDKIFE